MPKLLLMLLGKEIKMVYQGSNHAPGQNYAGSSHGGNVDYSMLGPGEDKQADYESMKKYEDSIQNDYHKLEKEDEKKKGDEKESIEKRLGEKQEKEYDKKIDDEDIKKKAAEELRGEIEQQKNEPTKGEKKNIEDAITKAIEEEKEVLDGM